MSRQVREMSVQEFYLSWWSVPHVVDHVKAWYSDDIYIVDIKQRMMDGRLYRLYLSNGKQRVVEPTFVLYIERY